MTVADWLDARRPAMPEALRAAVHDALRASSRGTGRDASGDVELADRLAGAALDTLDRVARAPAERSTAPALLAADALLTYACEAAAEAGPAALDRLVAELGPERFATLLDPVSP